MCVFVDHSEDGSGQMLSPPAIRAGRPVWGAITWEFSMRRQHSFPSLKLTSR